MANARSNWEAEAYTKRKLRTYVKIQDFESPGILIQANLPRRQRSLVTKLKTGVLPIRLETGRYKGLKEELRFCELCNRGKVEDKLHFLFRCRSTKACRKQYLKPLISMLPGEHKKPNCETLKLLLSKEHIKSFAPCLEQLYLYRQNLLYK